MTENQYRQASLIKSQIASIDNLLHILRLVDSFNFDPPTRQSGFELRCLYGDDRVSRTLNEGEAECLKEAL